MEAVDCMDDGTDIKLKIDIDVEQVFFISLNVFHLLTHSFKGKNSYYSLFSRIVKFLDFKFWKRGSLIFLLYSKTLGFQIK